MDIVFIPHSYPGRAAPGGKGIPWEGNPCGPKGSHGRGRLEAQGIPWEGTLGSPSEPMGGEPSGAQAEDKLYKFNQ
jgi:hypothetical protein